MLCIFLVCSKCARPRRKVTLKRAELHGRAIGQCGTKGDQVLSVKTMASRDILHEHVEHNRAHPRGHTVFIYVYLTKAEITFLNNKIIHKFVSPYCTIEVTFLPSCLLVGMSQFTSHLESIPARVYVPSPHLFRSPKLYLLSLIYFYDHLCNLTNPCI